MTLIGSESYQEVKSLVKSCGGKVNTTKLWNQFSKLRGKLKKVNGSATFHVDGNAVGYVKLKLDDNGSVIGFEEGGMTAALEAGGSVKSAALVDCVFGIWCFRKRRWKNLPYDESAKSHYTKWRVKSCNQAAYCLGRGRCGR